MTTLLNLSAPENSPVATRLARRMLRYQPGLLSHLEDLLVAVASYLPRVVTRPMIESPTAESVAIPLEGTVMFADINGFTQLAERFSHAASEEGAEELTALVNRFLEILITTTSHYGGDLQKFGGDAGMLLFTEEQHALRAVAASLEVQRAMDAQMSNVNTSLGQFALRVSIGLGAGRMVGIGLGDDEGREWLLSGTPLAAMGRAQSTAPTGSIVLDHSVYQLCTQMVSGTPLNADLFLVTETQPIQEAHPLVHLPGPPQVGEEARLDWLLSRLDALAPYLAPGLLERLATATSLDQVRHLSEHRQVTILMLSLSAIPDMSAHWHDPKALQRVIAEPNATFIRIRDMIRRYDGIVNKIGIGPQGPYLMALFGAPTAHEDDPLRAALAALELQEQAGAALRVGINTGFVFASDVGTAERREYTVMGDEVNLAYRLMAGCPPKEIWLGPHTAQHPILARRIDGELGQPQTFKGKSGQIAPFIARGLRQVFAGVETEGLPLVNREAELQRLESALADIQAGACQVVALHGPAGIGKSRLVHEIAVKAQAKGISVHTGAAPSYGAHLPYAAWERPILSVLGLENIPQEQRARSFQEALARYDLEIWAALLAPVAGIDIPASPEVAALTPELRERQRQAALLELWEKAAKEQPRLLIVENAQWMPPASLVLLESLITNRPAAPLLLLITHRDDGDFGKHWQSRTDVLPLALEALPRNVAIALARQVTHAVSLPREVERWIVQRGSGIPLFTIEAVRTLLTSGVLEKQDGHWKLAHPLEEAPLPETAYGMIQSRIDQLEPPSRHLLRAATVVGEQMTVPMLVAGYGEEPRPAVQRRLPWLTPLGLMPSDVQGETLIFRQPLIREVAYRGLPHQIRRLIHQRLADYLDHYREKATSNWLTLLAHHAFEGQDWELAVRANLDLGQHALNSYLTDQAVEAFRRALQAVEAGQLPDPDARFEAHHLLGETLTILGQYEEALEHLRQARGLLPTTPTTPEDTERLAHLKYHIAQVLRTQGRYEEAFEAVKRGLSLAAVEETLEGAQLLWLGAGLFHRQGKYEEEENWASRSAELAKTLPGADARRVLAQSLRLLSYLAYQRGELQDAITLGEESLEIYEQLQDLLGEMDTRNNLMLINMGSGRWTEAIHHGERALSLAERIHHTEGQAKVTANLGELYRYQGHLKKAQKAYTLALNITRKLGLVYGEALMENNLAALALQEGRWEEIIQRLDRAEALFQEIGAVEMLPELYRHRAEYYLSQQQPDMAWEWGKRSLQEAETQGIRREEGHTRRLLAEIFLALQQDQEAEKAIHQAIATAQENHDRHGEAQAIVTQAQLHYKRGDVEQANERLLYAVRCFEELDAAWDLARAQALLKQWNEPASDQE